MTIQSANLTKKKHVPTNIKNSFRVAFFIIVQYLLIISDSISLQCGDLRCVNIYGCFWSVVFVGGRGPQVLLLFCFARMTLFFKPFHILLLFSLLSLAKKKKKTRDRTRAPLLHNP